VTIEQSQEKSFTPSQRAEMMYQGRHSSPTLDSTRTATVSTDFSIDREMIRRVRYVFDQILAMLPVDAKKDIRYTAMKTMMYESLKDLARVPDDQICMMTESMANALMFVANGSMEDLEAAMAEEANAGD
jgi:hypothetical protein